MLFPLTGAAETGSSDTPAGKKQYKLSEIHSDLFDAESDSDDDKENKEASQDSGSDKEDEIRSQENGEQEGEEQQDEDDDNPGQMTAALKRKLKMVWMKFVIDCKHSFQKANGSL